jgi:hypothetical protein
MQVSYLKNILTLPNWKIGRILNYNDNKLDIQLNLHYHPSLAIKNANFKWIPV